MQPDIPLISHNPSGVTEASTGAQSQAPAQQRPGLQVSFARCRQGQPVCGLGYGVPGGGEIAGSESQVTGGQQRAGAGYRVRAERAAPLRLQRAAVNQRPGQGDAVFSPFLVRQ
ncbi:hypothetical protein, partial [Salmonella sp. SAL04162]|uniref:hypothetical protein n=1 Tax=Salmonella sp. SAL04162 TaxID=3159782 RepID=UPI003978468B